MLDADTRSTLLGVAYQSIEHGVTGGRYAFEGKCLNPILRRPLASFVTLKRDGILRGCIGTSEPRRPLLDDVIHNARAAAFADPRFPSLTTPELENLHIEISVLTVAESINASSRTELFLILKPHEDGLIVQEGKRGATFLPSVWSVLSDPDIFYNALMRKAGLDANHWSSDLKFFRYHTDSFGQEFSQQNS
ncbi:MAG: AmmeMemoRadiSam system protein A [Gammaproteobacteria bacterium]